jgi:hypothetical protein
LSRNVLAALSISLLVGASASAVARTDPAAATPPSAAQASTEAPATVKANPEDKVICKTQTPSGSRLGAKRVCMKKSDWEAQSQTAGDQLRFRPPQPR